MTMTNAQNAASQPKIIRDLSTKVSNLTRHLGEARRERDMLRDLLIDIKANGLGVSPDLEPEAATTAYRAAEARMKKKIAEVLNSSLE